MKSFIKKLMFGKGQVSPTIKSVKPTKDIKGSVERTKTDEYRKRYTILDKAEDKIKTGKKMIKEGQKARKNLIDTKRAFQFKHTKSTHAIRPGENPNVKYKGSIKEQKATGGRVGKKFGGGMDMGRRKTNVEKIKETFATKSNKKKNLKPVDKKKNPGLAKLPIEVRNKMGYAKKGGRA